MCLLGHFTTRDLGEGDKYKSALVKMVMSFVVNNFKFPTLGVPSTGVRVKRHAALAFFPGLTPVCDNHGTSFWALRRLACASVPAWAMKPSWSHRATWLYQ